MEDEDFAFFDKKIDTLRKKTRDPNDFKIEERVFDDSSFKALYELATRGFVEALGGAVATGKEANVYHAFGKDRIEVAVKVYKISTSLFKKMNEYLDGDRRFYNVGKSKRAIVYLWTQKEYRNLKKAFDLGIRVPKPITFSKNILLMEFIGENEVSAPLLKDCRFEPSEWEEVWEKLTGDLKTLYLEAGLVHGDLSEYNILYHNAPVLIDMGQSVARDHPMFERFLDRDLENISRFFRKKGIEIENEELREYITSKDLQEEDT